MRSLVDHKERRLGMQAAMDDDPTQTQQQLAEALNVSQETISRHLRAMGKINKIGKRAPHNFNDQQNFHRKITCEILLQRQESHFCTEL